MTSRTVPTNSTELIDGSAHPVIAGLDAMIKVVVADDHQVVREGIKKTLAAQSDIAVVGEAADAHSLLAILTEQEADIVLLDLGLCPPNELAVLRIVHERFPMMPILVVTSHAESQFGIESLREGASGYVTKSMAVDVIVNAIRKICAGGRYVSESLGDLLAHELTAPKNPHPHELLTERETQVMALLAMGLSIKQVAGRLDISISSVNTYRIRILTKMQLRTNAELIRYAVKHDLTA